MFISASIGTIAFAGFTACNREQATAPLASRPVSNGGASRTTVTTLGTYSIPIPGTSLDNDGAQPVANTGIIVPAGTYYRVRVKGTTTVSTNPPYALLVPYFTYPYDGSYGPGGAGGFSYLLVQLKARNTNGSGTSPINFPNLGYGTAAPDSARSDILFANTQVEIQAGRNGLPCSAGQGSTIVACYLLSASQTVTVEAVTDVIHEVANPVAVHPNQQVIFTASRDDGGALNISTWYWQPDPGKPGSAGTACGWAANPSCQKQVAGSGTMTVYADVGYATAHVTVYTNFTLDADKTSAYVGESVTFTPKLDGVASAAARWKWVPDSTTDSVACSNAVTNCTKLMLVSGTMWAYLSTTPGQGDSASRRVSVTPRRKLLLNPSDTVWVEIGTTVTFTASGEGGAAVVNPHWSGSDETIVADRIGTQSPKIELRRNGGMRSMAFSAATNSTCIDGVTTCSDDANGPYTRAVTATVDDSIQTRSVTVIAGYIDHPAPEDSMADGAAGPCRTCQKIDSLKRLNIDSIMRHMDTTTAKCDSAYIQLQRYLNHSWIYVFTEKTAKWGRWSPPDYNPIWNLSSWSPWIELSTALWTPPGKKVIMGMLNGVPIIMTVTDHRLEQTVVHESLHAAGYDHDSADQFKSTTLKACMNPNSRNW